MKKSKQFFLSKTSLFIPAAFLCFYILTFLCSNVLRAENGIDELNLEIKRKKREIEELKRQQEIYEENIDIKRSEIASLKNQLDLLENQLTRVRVKIEITETEIKKNNFEQENIKLQINQKENKIKEQKDQLVEFIRLIHREDQRSYLEILLLNDSLAEFFDQIKYSESLQESLQKTLDKIQLIKDALLVQKKNLENKKEELDEFKKELTEQKAQLEYQGDIKTNFLAQTEGAEQKFQKLLAELRREQVEANAEIISLEQEIRKKLAQREKAMGGNETLGWPVTKNKITAYFHDPDYPFRYLFEHPGIDIRAEQGTPVKAASSGYVARAKDAGMGYSYIMIIHDQGLATVYGHIFKILIQEDTYVTKDQTIGLSGGLPGTSGAGSLSTGPHLHFEVRLNGIPVDPLGYLP